MRSLSLIALLLGAAACAEETPIGTHESALSVPAGLEVAEGNHVVAAHHAVGFQVYECRSGAWAFRAPIAVVYADDGTIIANHFGGIDAGLPAGPYWQSVLDGSRVHAGSPVAVPNPGAIPLLKLTALDSTGPGIFADVSFIQRLETTGGVAPTKPCRKELQRNYVPYTADYVFWSTSLPRPEVPETIAVPEGHDVAYVGQATGLQIYECTAGAWKLRAPSALLTDADGDLATHFGGIDVGLPAGPYWESVRDGSRVHAGNAISSPNPGHIPLLRLQGLDTAGHGVFSRVSYIQRLATQGGVAPTGACEGGTAEVPYTSDYYFFVPRS